MFDKEVIKLVRDTESFTGGHLANLMKAVNALEAQWEEIGDKIGSYGNAIHNITQSVEELQANDLTMKVSALESKVIKNKQCSKCGGITPFLHAICPACSPASAPVYENCPNCGAKLSALTYQFRDALKVVAFCSEACAKEFYSTPKPAKSCENSRFYVDERGGCIAVRDSLNKVESNGLHSDFEDVVAWWDGEKIDGTWTVSESARIHAHECATKLNMRLPKTSKPAEEGGKVAFDGASQQQAEEIASRHYSNKTAPDEAWLRVNRGVDGEIDYFNKTDNGRSTICEEYEIDPTDLIPADRVMTEEHAAVYADQLRVHEELVSQANDRLKWAEELLDRAKSVLSFTPLGEEINEFRKEVRR